MALKGINPAIRRQKCYEQTRVNNMPRHAATQQPPLPLLIQSVSKQWLAPLSHKIAASTRQTPHFLHAYLRLLLPRGDRRRADPYSLHLQAIQASLTRCLCNKYRNLR